LSCRGLNNIEEKEKIGENPMATQINIIQKSLYKFSLIKTIERLGLTLKARQRGYNNRTLLNVLLIAIFLG